MANPEHLAVLTKGVTAWNEWREKNPDIKPDLIGANLGGADLHGANLGRANLRSAYLIRADLHEANLIEADLGGANLHGANLGGAYLIEADLGRADLIGANLGGAALNGANLGGADLSKAYLSGADLDRARFSAANLENANVQYCQLCQCDLTNTTLTGAKLYGTARDDWILDGVECRYVFWDRVGVIRSPEGRDFAPGEFEQIYKTLPTIEYVFQHRMTPMDPLIMDRVVQAIRQQNPEYDIKIDSVNARGLAPSIKFTVQQEEHKEPALAEVTRVYEAKLQEFAGRLDEARAFIELLIDRPNSVYIENPTGPLAIGGSTINIDQHVEYITNLRDAVAALPEDSPTFAKVAKKTALDIIGSALKDVAKGQVKEAANQIYELSKDLGPAVLNTAAYTFFKSCLGQ